LARGDAGGVRPQGRTVDIGREDGSSPVRSTVAALVRYLGRMFPVELLVIAASLLAADLLATLVWMRRNRAKVGRVLHRVRRRRTTRAVIVALVAGAAGIAVVARDQVPLSVALVVLALAGLVLAISPGFLDTAYGELGVQRGWHARRFEELEEWRLIGQHLRWRLFGEWVATDVPVEFHPELRAKLERLGPESESAHGNRGLDPQRAAPSTLQSAGG
jgi:hypothetical protein